MNLFKNFIHMFRHYKTASILNLIGLTVAFASFILILAQVRYDLGYDRQYGNADRIFRVERSFSSGNESVFIPLHATDISVAEQITAVSPDIVKNSGWQWYANNVYDGKQQRFTLGDDVCCVVSESWFDLFGFECISGGLERIGEPYAAAISESLADRIFPGRSPIGELLFPEDTGEPVQIVAVYKDFPKNSTVKNGIYLVNTAPVDNSAKHYVLIDEIRHKAQIEADLTRKAREVYEDSAALIRLTPLHDVYFSTDCAMDTMIEKGSRTTTFSLIAIAVLILAIATINSVNFAIAQVPIRIRSLNTRKIFGCRNSKLQRGLLVENIGMTLAAFILAVATAYALAPSLANIINGDISWSASQPTIWLSAAVALASGLLGGLYPAFYSTSFNPAFVAKGNFGHSPAGKRLRMLLVSVQFIISIALIATALFVYKQNRFMVSHDPGFQRQNVLTTTISGKTAEQLDAYAGRLTAYPGVSEVAFGDQSFAEATPGRSRSALYKGNPINYYHYLVSDNFISFMGLKIIDGRNFDRSDEHKENRPLIFNRTARTKYDLEIGTPLSPNEDIVGIVQDFNFQPLHYPVTPMAFQIAGDRRRTWLQTVYIKTNGPDIAATLEHIRKTGAEFDLRNADQDIVFMDQALGQLYRKERNFSTLIALFSLLSVLISIIGVFGLVTFETRHRRKEIGIRKVHGATVGEILRMFNKTYIRIVLVCFVIAAPVAYFAIRKWLEQFAYKAPVGIGVFVAGLLVVLLVVVATISLQCYKTANANPVDSIKKE